jgi:ABC-type protease/lipase transport system fused ATPase/permease subunit
MKDITITGKRVRYELTSLLVCFIISFILNIGAIIFYKSPWTEIFTSIFYVISFAIALYVAWIIIRLIVCGIKKIRRK